ncbi:oxygenase MpaB family protein [Spirillospora albida]|uniref:oxygenase MpaB family protein n=1 Tax=Spirillospora albida TaxID=58123 RepID=UPI0004BE4923|nr:oxygenase MpaB family protein [Spirillospora albida]
MAAEAPPRVVLDSFTGLALTAAAANVVMQLSRLPIGRGVAESKVDSGRVDKRPLKRARTTLAYIAVAMLGTEEERAAMRREVNRQHRQVRAKEPVSYNAFDRELQLWVAACLYVGVEMIYPLCSGPLSPADRDALYRHGARFGTTLQMPEEMWPADRDAFEEYWQKGMSEIKMDDVTRTYLQNLTDLKFLPAAVQRTLGPFHRMVTLGFLPEPFRDELGLPWTRRDQARFDRFTRRFGAINRTMPGPVRRFPFNMYLWDTRRRIRHGRPIV